MKKYLLTLAVAAICTLAVSTSFAQSASFTFDDHNGTPNAGTYNPTNSFTFTIMLNFAPGGTVANIAGLSYWFDQNGISSPPFNFSITNRDLTGSPFSTPITTGIVYPQTLMPVNTSDLGATSAAGMGMGTYFIANLTVFISGATAPGTYVIESSVNGKTSQVTDSNGNSASIVRTLYTITVVPETGSSALLLGLGVAGLFGLRWRQQQV